MVLYIASVCFQMKVWRGAEADLSTLRQWLARRHHIAKCDACGVRTQMHLH